MPQHHRNWALSDADPAANASPLDSLQRHPSEVVAVPDARWRVQAWLSTQPRPDHNEPPTPREGDGPQWPQPRAQGARQPCMTMQDVAEMVEGMEEPAAAACLSALPPSLAPKVLHLLPLEARAKAFAAMPLDAAVMCIVMLGSADRDATLSAVPRSLAVKVSAVLSYGQALVVMPLPNASETLARMAPSLHPSPSPPFSADLHHPSLGATRPALLY